MARPSIKTPVVPAVVHVDGAVLALPAVDTETLEALVLVLARPAITAHARGERALVHVLGAVLAFPVWWALAVIVVGSVHTCSAISTCMRHTVILVLLTIVASETSDTLADVCELSRHYT